MSFYYVNWTPQTEQNAASLAFNQLETQLLHLLKMLQRTFSNITSLMLSKSMNNKDPSSEVCKEYTNQLGSLLAQQTCFQFHKFRNHPPNSSFGTFNNFFGELANLLFLRLIQKLNLVHHFYLPKNHECRHIFAPKKEDIRYGLICLSIMWVCASYVG